MFQSVVVGSELSVGTRGKPLARDRGVEVADLVKGREGWDIRTRSVVQVPFFFSSKSVSACTGITITSGPTRYMALHAVGRQMVLEIFTPRLPLPSNVSRITFPGIFAIPSSLII